MIDPSAVITSKDGLEHQLTREDALWAARAASWESYGASHPSATATDAQDVLWTLTQRYARWRGQGKTFDFVHSTRTFSQPLSPKWASKTASGCKARPDLCTDSILARRREAQNATWDDLKRRDRERGTNVVETVEQWARGELPNSLPRSTNFAQPGVSQSHMNKNPTSEIIAKRGGHWYIADYPATKWDDDHVQMIPVDAPPVTLALRQGALDFRDGFVDVLTLKWWAS